MAESVVIIGKSGHGKVIADIILSRGDNIVGFLDDAFADGETVLGFPLLGKVSDYRKYYKHKFIIAIGNPYIREKIALSTQAEWYTAVHPRAVVSGIGVRIGPGSVVGANAVINPCSEIGCHCIINTSAVVEHDNRLDDYCHISPGAVLAGTVKIGKFTHIGAGASVINNISIADGCIIGAGAAVTKDITESGTYAGVPARKIK